MIINRIVSLTLMATIIGILLMTSQQPAQSAEPYRIYVYASMASFCEKDGCSITDFYPVIDPNTGEIVSDVYLFLPNDGECYDFRATLESAQQLTINTWEEGSNDDIVGVSQQADKDYPVNDVCSAAISFEHIFDMDLLHLANGAPEAQLAKEIVEAAMPQGGYFIGLVPAGSVVAGWTGSTLLVLQPGSVTTSPIEHYVLYQIPIVSE